MASDPRVVIALRLDELHAAITSDKSAPRWEKLWIRVVRIIWRTGSKK